MEFALNQLFSMGAFVIATDIQRKCLRISNVYMHYRALFEFINDDHTFFPLAMKQMKTKVKCKVKCFPVCMSVCVLN